MNKAILVIDMPENCKNCMCYVLGAKNNFCERTRFAILNNSVRQDWCPIKSLPEKYEIDRSKCSDRFYEFEFEHGYNQCINEILGE